MEWLVDIETLTQRISLVLLGLMLHGLGYGGLAFIHSISPLQRRELFTKPLLQRCVLPLLFQAEDKLNRADRAPAKRAWRGGFVLLMLLIFGWVLASFITLFSVFVVSSIFPVLFTVVILLPIGPFMLSAYVHGGNASHIPGVIDEAHRFRLMIEQGARVMMETILLILGFIVSELHGLVAAALICTLYHTVCLPTTRYIAYGTPVRMLYKALCFIPAVLLGLCVIVAACFVPHCSPLGAIRSYSAYRAQDKVTAPYPAFLYALLAGALNLSLGGPYRAQDTAINAPWMGSGTAQLTPHHLRIALWHGGVCALLCVMLLGVISG